MMLDDLLPVACCIGSIYVLSGILPTAFNSVRDATGIPQTPHRPASRTGRCRFAILARLSTPAFGILPTAFDSVRDATGIPQTPRLTQSDR